MKLKNKKTGQVGNFIINKDHFECVDLDYVPEYRNLAELNEEWEDYEENNYYWYIDDMGMPSICNKHHDKTAKRKAFGNYFETKEEAELAVRKLKAFKELKDKGFKFRDWYIGEDGAGIEILANYPNRSKDNLNLLFGGEELQQGKD